MDPAERELAQNEAATTRTLSGADPRSSPPHLHEENPTRRVADERTV